MNNQEPSTSSSFTTKNIMDNDEEKKEESKPESENKEEVENNCFIDDLPPEMLMKILKYLDVQSLAVSRLMNRRWNGMARELLESRDDLEATVYLEQTENRNFTTDQKSQKTTLENFIKCFEGSKETPLYFRFLFCSGKSSGFDHTNWIKFSFDFRESVKCVKLAMGDFVGMNADSMREFAEKLRNLLLNQLPNLQEFGVRFVCCWESNVASHVPIFPIKNTPSNENETSKVQLPHLKVLYLDGLSFSHYTRIFTDLLHAADNLQEIEPFYTFNSHLSEENLCLLHVLGKLHLVQTLEIVLSTSFLLKINRMHSAPLVFNLKKLKLHVSQSYDGRNMNSVASVFISNLFESSKDTLTDLTMPSLNFVPALRLPKFSKLTSLCIHTKSEEEVEVSDAKLNLMEIFPVLQNLELKEPWTDFFPHYQSLIRIPNLKTLVVPGHGMTEQVIARISQVCPNLKDFGINYPFGGSIENFPEVGTAIWTHMKQLESLNLLIDMDNPANAFPAVDSCFTGFSKDYCEQLHELILTENKKFLKNPRSQIKIPHSKSQSELDAARENPSILDLKDLKKLKVTLKSDIWGEEKNPALFKNLLTAAVIEEYAFKFMENLNYEIRKWNKSPRKPQF